MGPTTALALHAMLELGLPLHRVTPYTEGVQLQAKCQQAIAEAFRIARLLAREDAREEAEHAQAVAEGEAWVRERHAYEAARNAKPKPGEAVFINAGSASAVGEALDS